MSQIQTQTTPGADGLTLAYDAWGDPEAPPLVLLHGGGQTRGSWSGAGPGLAERGWHVLAVDHRGHGESEWAPDGEYSHVDFARDVDVLARSLDQPPVLVGASLGGISSLLAVGELETPARAVVLVDVAHRADRKGVQRIVDFMNDKPEGFESIEEAAEAVAAYLPHRPPPRDPSGLRRNLRRKGDRWVWHWDPRLFKNDVDDPSRRTMFARNLAAAKRIECPVLVVRGGLSDVLSEEIAAEFLRAVPHAELVEVPSAAHMVAGDRNDRFVGALQPFLDGL